MFSSCIVHCRIIWALGEGGVGVFVGGGGMFGCDESMKEYSEMLSEVCCSPDNVREDLDVGDELLDKLSPCEVAATGMIVSALERETKHLCSRGCFLQASVDSC